MPEQPAIPFKVEPATVFRFKPRDIKEDAGTLRDGTALTGKMIESPMMFHYVDAIDFRHTAMKAEEKGIDPEVAIENSWLLKENPELREAWEWHKGEIAKLEKKLIDGYGVDKKTGKPNRVPTETERYRIGWQAFAAKAEGVETGTAKIALKEQFFGPDYVGRSEKHTFPAHVSIPREQVQFASKFAPAWNTYYAIYFTMTGLHGLHVIGGALVLAYYLFCGKKMYLSNPEWLANRVEVGGLFWHFVDLVWIFLFPILYLM
ncbi:heme-copper oxidase subunit III [Luteolibacter luteus]|uniref:Heme-copper oxidase subunit III n=2 Tax=Luteolibacter luteus TaxID=2728835 RepID=A0A858RQW4_9BACT|nr:heme-copper oxidase subunit III [Luteolibacter luteus]